MPEVAVQWGLSEVSGWGWQTNSWVTWTASHASSVPVWKHVLMMSYLVGWGWHFSETHCAEVHGGWQFHQKNILQDLHPLQPVSGATKSKPEQYERIHEEGTFFIKEANTERLSGERDKKSHSWHEHEQHSALALNRWWELKISRERSATVQRLTLRMWELFDLNPDHESVCLP